MGVAKKKKKKSKCILRILKSLKRISETPALGHLRKKKKHVSEKQVLLAHSSLEAEHPTCSLKRSCVGFPRSSACAGGEARAGWRDRRAGAGGHHEIAGGGEAAAAPLGAELVQGPGAREASLD